MQLRGISVVRTTTSSSLNISSLTYRTRCNDTRISTLIIHLPYSSYIWIASIGGFKNAIYNVFYTIRCFFYFDYLILDTMRS